MSAESNSENAGPEDTLASGPRVTAAVSESDTGRRIGPYRLVQLIGEGGMGEVWLAEQFEPRRKVAIKLIKAGMDTKQVVARFESERQALALMDHPAIAKVFDGGSTPEGRPYFVMEYVAGVPITDHCDTNKLSTVERLELLTEVCEGVQHAHQKAIIHRDLKPSNILVSLVDGKPQPKIIDFGIAKATGYRLTEKTLYTELGAIIGTPEYMSPEQADLTSQDVDTRTDVYSLGVILYQLITGELPFSSKELRSGSYDELRRKLREVEPPRPSTKLSTLGDDASQLARNRDTDASGLRKLLEGDLDAITMKALEKERARRYGTPSELAADIGRHLRHEPVIARPPSLAYRVGKYVRRHRLGVGLAMGLAALLLAFAVTMAIETSRTALARDRANAERDRANRERDASDKVSAFLANMLSRLKPEALGDALWKDLHQRVAAARRSRGEPEEKVGATLASLDEALAGVSPTQTALNLLDGQILERAGKTLTQEMGAEPRIAGRLEHALARTYRNLGLYKQAEEHAKRAVERRTGEVGPDNPETLQSVTELANIYYRQGRYDEAEKLNRESLEVRRRVLGPAHQETLQSMNNLAMDYDAEGRYDEAEKLDRETLDVKRRVLGPDHPDTLNSMNNLSIIYFEEGQYEKCEELVREVLEIRRRVLPADQLETLQSMGNLANILDVRGRHEEAEKLYGETLEADRRVLGPDHPDTLLTMQNLAELYTNEGRFSEAEGLYQRALEAMRRVLGTGHTLTLVVMSHIAQVYQYEGRYDEAEKVDRETLGLTRQLLGRDHPQTLACLANLADVLNAQGRYSEAKEFALEAKTGLERRKSGSTGDARAALGRSLTGLKRYPQAELELIEAEHLLSTGKGVPYRRCLEALVAMYGAWEKAESGLGHAAQAAEWKAKLDAQSIRQ
jgi:serine/threonine protein kinase